MNKREQDEAELKSLRSTINSIEEAWLEGRTNDDGDKVIPEHWCTRINMLLEV